MNPIQIILILSALVAILFFLSHILDTLECNRLEQERYNRYWLEIMRQQEEGQ